MKNNTIAHSLLAVFFITVLAISLSWLLAVPVNATSFEFAGGNGTTDDPYLIETKEHLNNVRNDLGAHYKMIADIVFTDADFSAGGDFYNDGSGWDPIGDKDNSFSGTFDGNGHIIRNLYINAVTLDRGTKNSGLFRSSNGTIKCLGVVDAVINVYVERSSSGSNEFCTTHAGGIAGSIGYRAIVEECYFSGKIELVLQSYNSSVYLGGIVGRSSGTVKNCYNIGAIQSATDGGVGGIVGCNYGDIITCYNIGNVSGSTYAKKGGIAAYDYEEDILDCYFINRNNRGAGNNANLATACSLDVMQLSSTYVGFDFQNIWTIDADTGYTLPKLRNVKLVQQDKASADFAGGSGTLWDPFIIKTTDHLNNIRYYLDASFALGSDISFNESDFGKNGSFYNDGNGWLPIGTVSAPFWGNFDGRGYKISNLYINTSIESSLYIGLFGYADSGCVDTIKNTNVINCTFMVSGTSTTSSSSITTVYIGAIAGSGDLNNCSSSGEISISYTSSKRDCRLYVGGIAGEGGATSCVNACDISVTSSSTSSPSVYVYLGGIVGDGSNLVQCRNTGAIRIDTATHTNTYAEVGGVAGYATDLKLCANEGSVWGNAYNARSVYLGGICGSGTSSPVANIEQCYNAGNVIGSNTKGTGGIVGYLWKDSNIANCFNVGHVSGGVNGGIVGVSGDETIITNCYNSGYINNGYSIVNKGGIVQQCYGLANVSLADSVTTICTIEEIFKQETFNGFDFNDVWQIGCNSNYNAPELKGVLVQTILTNIADTTMTFSAKNISYHDIQPEFDITYNGKTLILNEDYIAYFFVGDRTWRVEKSTRSYIHDVGTGKLMIVGIGDFGYTSTTEFTIGKYDLSNSWIRSGWTHYFEYDGSPKEQSTIELYDSSYHETISPEHYTVTYINNVEIGTATMIITGVGDYYTGTLEKQFEIRPRSIQSVQVSKSPNKLSYNSCHKNRSIDVTGGEITVYYKDGFSEVFSMDATMLLTKTFYITSGNETVWVSYDGNITSYDVYVYAEHEYTTTVYAPTYTSTGYTVYTCWCGESYRSNFVDIVPIPIPNATAKSDSQTGEITLKWDYNKDFIYEIYRASSKTGKYDRVHVLAESSWIDASAAVGKTYYYKVKAVYAADTNFSSGFSSIISADSKCASPTLTVQAGSTGKPVLSWNKISGAKKYEIWRSVDGGAFKKLTTVTKLTYTDTKATAGAECTYKVKALGSKSTYNGEFSEIDSCYVICAAPSITVKLDSKTGKPSLSWKKVTGAKSYAIYRSVNGGEYQQLTTTTSVSYQDKTAEADNKYSYYVVTLGKAEEFNSVASAVKSVTLAVKAPKLSGSANAIGNPVISWSAVENAVSYEIYRSTKSNKSYTLLDTTAELSYTDATVATGKTYYYKVVAVGTNTESAQSSYLKQVGKCATPTIQVVLDEDSGKPMISWEKIEGAKKYTVYRATSETGKYSKLGTTTKLTYTDTKASVGTKYFYKIVANPSSSSANSNYSNIENGLTICAKAVITAKIDAATGKPTLSWKKVTGAKTYEIYRSENGGEYILVATQTAVTYKDTTAVAGNTYSYQVKVIASKTGADSLLSAEKTVIASCAQPKIKGKVGATGKPELTWGEIEGATKYIIYRSTSKSKGYTVLEETETLSFTDTTAVKGKTYYYKVVAICDETESAQSAYCKVKSK